MVFTVSTFGGGGGASPQPTKAGVSDANANARAHVKGAPIERNQRGESETERPKQSGARRSTPRAYLVRTGMFTGREHLTKWARGT